MRKRCLVIDLTLDQTSSRRQKHKVAEDLGEATAAAATFCQTWTIFVRDVNGRLFTAEASGSMSIWQVLKRLMAKGFHGPLRGAVLRHTSSGGRYVSEFASIAEAGLTDGKTLTVNIRLLSISVPALPSPTLSRKVSAARTTHTRGNEHTTVPVLNRSKLQVDLMAHEAALFTNPALKSTAEQLFAKVLTQCNICCEVVKGDLTKQDVAAIVNPTNIRLQLHGAVSKAVLTTVGPIFKVICKVWLASHFGCLLECGAATTRLPPETRAFRMLKYQRVTHAAVPYSTGSVQQDDANLRRTVQAVLQAVKVAKVESVAVPLLGAGAAGWPTALAAKALVGQVVEMISSTVVGRTLKEVRFVDVGDAAISALRNELYSDGKVVTHSVMGVGSLMHCTSAQGYLKQNIGAHMTSINIKLSHLLGHQERTDMLQSPALAHVMMSVSSDDVLTLTGCKELVAQAETHVLRVVANKGPLVHP